MTADVFKAGDYLRITIMSATCFNMKGIQMRKGQRIYLLFFVLLLIYFPPITGLLIYSRYRIPMVPFYLVISAFGMVECFGRLKVFSRHLDGISDDKFRGPAERI